MLGWVLFCFVVKIKVVREKDSNFALCTFSNAYVPNFYLCHLSNQSNLPLLGKQTEEF